jgi:hypothetical protein
MSQEEMGTGTASQAPQGRVIENVGLLDWRSMTDKSDLDGILALHNVGTVLITESMATAVAALPMENVGSVLPVPTGVNVSLLTGQTRLSGEALAEGSGDTILMLIGQALITSPVTQVGFKELRVMGQLVAPRGSEAALSAKTGQLLGQTLYYPWLGDGVELRTVTGEERISAGFLQALPKPVVLLAIGEVTFEEGIAPELLQAKMPAMAIIGQAFAPRDLLPTVQALASEHLGEIIGYPQGARFYTGSDTLLAEDFEYMPDAAAIFVHGDLTLAEGVTAAMVKAKVREIGLAGTIKAPRALLPLLRSLISEKHGDLKAIEDEAAEE